MYSTIQQEDMSSVLHPYTNLATHLKTGPMVITRGDGSHVIDETGKRYIEGLSGLFCCPLGFSEPRLAARAHQQMLELPFYHGFGSKASAPAAKLAERLLAMSPVPMSKVFFASSGSEANDTALKMIWYYFNAMGKPEKRKIISRQRAYHGVTVAAASLSGLPYVHKAFNLPIADIFHVDSPSLYHHGLPGESEEAFASRMAEQIEALILREGPDTVAAMYAEPVQASGGIIVPPKGYFEKVQAILDKYDILLVADEVICGFGRTGNLWGSQTYGMRPDIINMAKQLSNGYLPISAMMVNEKIMGPVTRQSGEIGTFGHGFTYSGHPVAAAVALETLDIYQEIDAVERVRSLMPSFQRGMHELGDHPMIGEVRLAGFIGGLEIVADREKRNHFPPALGVGNKLVNHAQNGGLITRALNNTFSFCPPYIITEAEMARMFEIAKDALDRTWAEVSKV